MKTESFVRKTGIFGGSFNPPTIAHVEIAKFLLNNREYEEIWWIPARQNPLKAGKSIVEPALRLEMLKAALRTIPQFKILDIELKRDGLSYTYDTINELSNNYPDRTFELIIGADNLESLHKWKNIEKILDIVVFVVVTRPGFENSSIPEIWQDRIIPVKAPAIPLSSTMIRQRIRENSDISKMLDPDVLNMIQDNGLYLK